MKISDLLNKEQLEAATHKDGPLLILAGAGSGKTRVITYRIAYLISEYGVSPANILAVTFTNKAAGEMKSRILNVVGKTAESIWMSTFHSMGVRILRHHADKIGFTRDFTIYDEDDRERLVKECMHAVKISEKEMKPYRITRYISDIKNRLIGPEEYEESHANDYETEIISRIYKVYSEKIKRNNAMDFDDLISRPIELFKKHPEVLSLYQNKFKYILIDEYQDINNSQYTLISLIAKKYKNICVVGDDDQSIYKFRGADISNILDFEEDYHSARVIRLEQNYRSTRNILKAAHSVIRNNRGRKEKELWTENPEGDKITFFYTNNELHEAESITSEVEKELAFRRASLRDFSVFYRTNAQSRVIEDRFRRAGIPYKLVGGIQFYSRMEIKDMLAYLRIVSNPRDVISFKRIINVPPRGVGDVSIEKLEDYSMEKQLSFFDALGEADKVPGLKDSAKGAVKKFYGFISRLFNMKKSSSLQDLIREIISGTGYINYWQNDSSPKSDERVENVKELVSAISEYEEGNDKASLEDFLNQVALVTDIDRMDPEANAVTLMTIHSAKGLEFDYVFIAGMDENIFPHRNCIDEPGGIEEERRLCYVGITRARKKLYVMSSVERRQYGARRFGAMSRFIDEIPEELIELRGRMPVRAVKRKIQEEDDSLFVDEEPDYDAVDEEALRYSPGDTVMHKKMGKGSIVKAEPYGDDIKVTVVFKKHGKKVLSAKYAGLEKI